MRQITTKTLRDVEWRQVYQYTGINTSFTTHACDALPGVTITHEKVGSRRSRSIYTVNGRKTDSPTQAVKYYNEEAKRQAGIGQPPAGSAEQIRQSRRDAGL